MISPSSPQMPELQLFYAGFLSLRVSLPLSGLNGPFPSTSRSPIIMLTLSRLSLGDRGRGAPDDFQRSPAFLSSVRQHLSFLPNQWSLDTLSQTCQISEAYLHAPQKITAGSAL